jgi:hypothetical protein
MFSARIVAHTPGGPSVQLGEHRVASPRLALRSLRGRAQDLTDQLDPPYARVVRAWLRDTREHERALAAMAAGRPYLFLATDEDGTRYAFTAEPLAPIRPTPLPGLVRKAAPCLAA